MAETKQVEGQQGDACSPPSWLNKELIEQAVRNGGENSRVEAIAVSTPVAAGENYGSTIYRAKATLTDGQERSFIIKGPTPAAALSSVIADANIFEREETTLAHVIPQMQALLEEAAPGRFPPLAPRCYHQGSSPVEFLVLEDLGAPGFKLADRKRGLGLRHSLLALRNLARFHAASHALLKRKPELVDKLDNVWVTVYNTMGVYTKGIFQAAIEACRSWPGFDDCASRLEKFKATAMDTFVELNYAKPDAFNVIVHGDYWTSNMMFRYEDGELKEQRVFDLQLSHVASPAIDLVYFMYGSVSDNVHEHHQDLLLREYHSELKRIMELLGLQAPSLETLLSAVDVHGPYSLFVTLARPVIKAEKGVDVNAVFTGDHSCLVPVYELPTVKTWMQRVLQDYVRRGWLPA